MAVVIGKLVGPPNVEAEGLRAILRERERELIEAKGHCRNADCSLHRAHSGPCNTNP